MTEPLRIIVFCNTNDTKNLIINYFYNNVLLSHNFYDYSICSVWFLVQFLIIYSLTLEYYKYSYSLFVNNQNITVQQLLFYVVQYICKISYSEYSVLPTWVSFVLKFEFMFCKLCEGCLALKTMVAKMCWRVFLIGCPPWVRC